MVDSTLDWETAIPWLRSHTRLPIWLKGGKKRQKEHVYQAVLLTMLVVCSPEDVELAIKYGVDGIVISNHGGRQLDGVPATLDALRICAPVAQGRIPITIDGGIRRGSDIFKAIALGASHCFLGRIPIWGLAVRHDSATAFHNIQLTVGSTTAKTASNWRSRSSAKS